MTKRYTEKALKTDVEEFNKLLEGTGIDHRFEWGGSYGHQTIDVFRPSVREAGGNWMDYRCESGTPRECYRTMQSEYYRLLEKKEKES